MKATHKGLDLKGDIFSNKDHTNNNNNDPAIFLPPDGI